MILWKRAALFGFLSWLIPFFAAVIAFPLKQWNDPLFNTLMNLVVLLTGGVLLLRYFRDRRVSVHEALLLGTLWLAVNLALDYPMFAFGPMKMTTAAYYSQIGLDYLIYPLSAVVAARLAVAHQQPVKA